VTKVQEDIQQNLLDFSAVLSAVFSFLIAIFCILQQSIQQKKKPYAMKNQL